MSERRVVIDTRLVPRMWGGVAHAAKGLVEALGRLSDGDETYSLVISADEQRDWFAPYIGPNQSFVDEREMLAARFARERKGTSWGRRMRDDVKRKLRARAMRFMAGDDGETTTPSVELSWGLWEGTGAEVAHFPSQRFVLCSLPSVYQPHDLQHLHYPQFFSPAEITRREVVYRAGCRHAQTVVVGSQWIKRDVVAQYGTPDERVQVIPEGARTQFAAAPGAAALAAEREKLGLPEHFLLYPGVTWPHKNHCRLFEALRLLRDTSGLVVNLVCTGERYAPFWPEIERSVRECGLEQQVRFPGYLSEESLVAVYHMAQGLVLPSLFEASSLPIFEAWHAGVPVASSNATALPEQVLDAGLMFDPESVTSIANAVERLVRDGAMQESLVARGTRRLTDFDWSRTAMAYRAVYRRNAGWPMTDEDRWLLSWDWMRDPHAKPGLSQPV